MVKREVYKIILSGSIGVFIAVSGLLYWDLLNTARWNDIVSILLFAPVYGVGLIYGFRTVIKIIACLFKMAAPFVMFRGAFAYGGGCFAGCLGIMLKTIAAFVLLQLVFVVGWIAGIVYAGILLRDAQTEDDVIWS